MRKPKTNLELMQEQRKTWHIKPITKVHDNSKNKKKDRREAKEICKNHE